MSKDIIKKHLIVLKEEAKTPGIYKTEKIRDESGKTNKAANKDVAKEMEDYDKPLKDDSKPVKNEYTSKEKEYHEQMEIMNGQPMAEYGNEPSEIFKKRAEEAIAGSKRMGNANVDDNGTPLGNVVTADQAGFTGEKFGENLVKTIKASKKKRDDAETVRGPKTTVSGADIKDSSMSNKGSKSIALPENKINKKNKMKRLVFKNEFKGIENALKVIPESYKVNGKEFHMTDGNEKYEIKWEGSLTEGRAVILKASDKNLMTEDMAKMKHLMGYSSKETLGTVKGSARLDENARFNDILGKTKNLLNEGPVNGGMQGFTGEGNLGGTDESIVYSTGDKKGSEEAMSRRAVTPKYHGIVINDQGEPGGHVEVMYAPYTHNDVKYIDYDEFIEKYPGALEYYQANGNKTPEGRDIMDAFDEESLGLSGVHDMYEDFPDLTGDGKVTQADILKGRGVELNEFDANTFGGWGDKTLGMESPGLPKSPQIKLRSKADAGKTSLTYYFELTDKKGEDDRKGNLRMYIIVGDEPKIQYRANNLDDDNVEAFINKRKDDFVRMFNFYVENFSKEEMGEKLHVGGGYEDKVTDEDIASIKNGISKLKSVNIEKF